MKYIEQFRIAMNKIVCNPDFKIALSPVGSHLKISETLNPNQPVVPKGKLELPLGAFASLRSLVISNST